IGGDCPGKTELDPAILEAARVVVEYAPQTRIEGEIQQLSEDVEVTELWEVLAGDPAGRTDDAEITVFDSVGFALADFSALRCAQEATQGSDLLSWIDVIADPDDPKDLFSLVAAERPQRRGHGRSVTEAGRVSPSCRPRPRPWPGDRGRNLPVSGTCGSRSGRPPAWSPPRSRGG